ncbi:MAG TPA: hypothetical protein VHW44_04935 [Pseudonocardiaceae bacterium]|nr:hypothetical protein [Pseudonocardiaceae bacterium]
MGAAVILSACTGQQNSSSGGQVTTTTTAVSPATTTAAQVTKSTQVTTSAALDACASATKATLEAALKADEQISSALVIDSKGLQNIKCDAPWAVAGFSNNIDGGSVLFKYQNGAWAANDGGTDVCDDVPAATAKQICG